MLHIFLQKIIIYYNYYCLHAQKYVIFLTTCIHECNYYKLHYSSSKRLIPRINLGYSAEMAFTKFYNVRDLQLIHVIIL
jgi:hypothetical protein